MAPKKDFPKSKTAIIANAGTESTKFKIPDNAVAVGVKIPDITAGILYIECSDDEGVSFAKVVDPSTGEALIIADSGQDPAFVDISDYVRFATNELDFRIVSASAQGAEKTFKLYFSSL